MASKTKKPPQKRLVQDVLMTFYGHIEVYDYSDPDSDDKLVGTFLYPPEEFHDWDRYRWEATKEEPYNKIDMMANFGWLQKAFLGAGDQYDAIEIVWDDDGGGYQYLHRLVGTRPETDEEFAQRLAKIEAKEKAKLEKKELAKQKVLANKIERLKKLKEELGVV